MNLEITRDTKPGWAVLRPTGEVDIATVGELESALAATIEENSDDVVLDLGGVTFMDSTGLRTLLAAHQTLTAGGRRLAVVVEGGPVERLFDITGLNQTLELFPSLDLVTD
ncbi:MAG TPA: STAS domain-containing protein [Acidimicrobiia bacterium]|jgi:anti-sigma B factor antagonist|nr:STAS domain-containing protein [Acidimicrobiia bacterium]